MSCLVEFKRIYEVLPGTHFNEAVKEAITTAKKNDCIVNFMFNGVDVWVFKDSTLNFVRKEYEENYRLYERNYFYPQPGKRNKFFIALDSKEVPSGDYECLISVKPEKSDETELKVKIKIWPVKFEEIKDTHVSFFWSSFECIFSVLYPDVKEKDKQLEIWRKCLKHMYSN